MNRKLQRKQPLLHNSQILDSQELSVDSSRKKLHEHVPSFVKRMQRMNQDLAQASFDDPFLMQKSVNSDFMFETQSSKKQNGLNQTSSTARQQFKDVSTTGRQSAAKYFSESVELKERTHHRSRDETSNLGDADLLSELKESKTSGKKTIILHDESI